MMIPFGATSPCTGAGLETVPAGIGFKFSEGSLAAGTIMAVPTFLNVTGLSPLQHAIERVSALELVTISRLQALHSYLFMMFIEF